MLSWHGCLFNFTERFWSNLREFCYRNKTVFEIFFILLYSLEQLWLVWFTFKLEDPATLSLIVSIFAIIVLLTFALHKLIMESRIKILEKDLSELHHEKIGMEKKVRNITKNYQELLQTAEEESKNLNKEKIPLNKRGES